jgi:hypothetical protein
MMENTLIDRRAILAALLMFIAGTMQLYAQTAATDALSSSTGVSAWTNTRLAKTAAYTVRNDDKGKTIALGGSAFYPLIFAAPSDYDANFAVLLVNEDPIRAKTIAPAGLAEFTLWPGQSSFVFNNGKIWQYTDPGRWRLRGNITLFVDAANGSDANDGLAEGRGGALQTVQEAIFRLQKTVDFNHAGAIVQLAPGTYTTQSDGLHMDGRPVAGHSTSIVLRGAGSTRTILNSISGNALAVYYDSILLVESLRVQAVAGNAIVCSRKGIVYLGKDVDFGPTGGCHLSVSFDGMIMSYGHGEDAYSISGGAYAHTATGNKGSIALNGATYHILNNVAFKTFAIADSLSDQEWGGVKIHLNGHTVSGQRYQAFGNAIIEGVNGNETFFPGNVAGATSKGGIYQ